MVNSIFLSLKRRSDEVVLLGIGIFLFFVATNTQTGWLFLVDAVLFGALLMGFISSRIQIIGLKPERIYKNWLYEGEKLKVEISVLNTRGLSKHLLAVEDKFPASERSESKTFIIENIKGGKKFTVSYEEECFKRGIYYFEPLKIEAGAPLGFFPFGRYFRKNDKLIVFPYGPVIENYPAKTSSLYTVSQNRPYSAPGQSYDFLGIRDYKPGEETRYIHWKVTAKLGNLMVKEFKNLTSQEMTIFIDNSMDIGKGRESSLEYIIKAASSFANLSFKQNSYFKLLSLDGDKLTTLKNPGYFQCMEWLAGLTSSNAKISYETFEHIARETNYKTQLIILLASPDFEPAWLQPVYEKRASVKLLIFDADSFKDLYEGPEISEKRYDKLENTLKNENIPFVRIKKGEDLKKALLEGLSL